MNIIIFLLAVACAVLLPYALRNGDKYCRPTTLSWKKHAFTEWEQEEPDSDCWLQECKNCGQRFFIFSDDKPSQKKLGLKKN